MCQFIDKGLDRKGMVGARHRPQPAETNVSLRGAILDADIWNIKWYLNPIPLKLPTAMPRRASNVELIGGNTERCSQAVGLSLESSAALRYIAATGR